MEKEKSNWDDFQALIKSLPAEIKAHLDDIVQFSYEDIDFKVAPYLGNDVVTIAAFCYYYHFWSEDQYFKFRGSVVKAAEQELQKIPSVLTLTKSLWGKKNNGTEHRNADERDIELKHKKWLTDLIWPSGKMILARPERVLEESDIFGNISFFDLHIYSDYQSIYLELDSLFADVDSLGQGIRDTIRFIMNKSYLNGLLKLLKLCNKNIEPETFNHFWPIQFKHDPTSVWYLGRDLELPLFTNEFVPSNEKLITSTPGLVFDIKKIFARSNRLLSVEWGQAQGCIKCKKPKRNTIGNGKFFPVMKTDVGLNDMELTLPSRIYAFNPQVFKLENEDDEKEYELFVSQNRLGRLLQRPFEANLDKRLQASLCTLFQIDFRQLEKLQRMDGFNFNNQEELWEFLYRDTSETKLSAVRDFRCPLTAESVVTLGNFEPRALQEFKDSARDIEFELKKQKMGMEREQKRRFADQGTTTMMTLEELSLISNFYRRVIYVVFKFILHCDHQEGGWKAIFDKLYASFRSREKREELALLKNEWIQLSQKLKCVSLKERRASPNSADSEELPPISPVLKRS